MSSSNESDFEEQQVTKQTKQKSKKIKNVKKTKKFSDSEESVEENAPRTKKRSTKHTGNEELNKKIKIDEEYIVNNNQMKVSDFADDENLNADEEDDDAFLTAKRREDYLPPKNAVNLANICITLDDIEEHFQENTNVSFSNMNKDGLNDKFFKAIAELFPLVYFRKYKFEENDIVVLIIEQILSFLSKKPNEAAVCVEQYKVMLKNNTVYNEAASVRSLNLLFETRNVKDFSKIEEYFCIDNKTAEQIECFMNLGQMFKGISSINSAVVKSIYNSVDKSNVMIDKRVQKRNVIVVEFKLPVCVRVESKIVQVGKNPTLLIQITKEDSEKIIEHIKSAMLPELEFYQTIAMCKLKELYAYVAHRQEVVTDTSNKYWEDKDDKKYMVVKTFKIFERDDNSNCCAIKGYPITLQLGNKSCAILDFVDKN